MTDNPETSTPATPAPTPAPKPSVLSKLKSVLSSLVAKLKVVIVSLFSKLKAAMPSIVSKLKSLFSSIVAKVKAAYPKVVAEIKAYPKEVIGTVLLIVVLFGGYHAFHNKRPVAPKAKQAVSVKVSKDTKSETVVKPHAKISVTRVDGKLVTSTEPKSKKNFKRGNRGAFPGGSSNG